jgi:ElaB/YqjD/DUF883 family membrane-anchored ribosome-binding protein
MDEATRADSPEVEEGAAGESRSPDEIRQDIEETRAELGDTVEALAAKADVKAQAKERVAEVKENAKDGVESVKESIREAAPESAGAGAAQVKEKARSNPLPFAVAGALVAGFVLGRITAGDR